MARRRRRFRGLFGLDPVRDVDAEMAFHLDMRIRELIDRGETPERARELALQRFGDYEASRQDCVTIDTRRRRHIMRIDFLTDRLHDVRYALRLFRRAPAFTAVAIITLALGIGANAAVFSLFHDVLLQRLSVPDPAALVNLSSPGPKPGPKSCGGLLGDCDHVFSYPMFKDLERLQTVFTGVAAHVSFQANVGYRGETGTATGMFVSGSYFPVLALRPAIGRLLVPDDERTPNEGEVVVLSHDYWMRQRGGRTDVLGQTMIVNGIAMTAVGVAPPGFAGTTPGLTPDVFVPLTMRWRLDPWQSPPENRRGYFIYLFARLKPGVTPDQALAAIDPPYRAIVNDVELPLQQAGSLNPRQLEQFKAKGLRLEPGDHGQSSMPSDVRGTLTLLLAVTGLMLIITSLNVANLLLARTLARGKEIATRLSIGATRARVIGQLLTESAVLGVVAALASLLVAQWTLGLLPSIRLADGTMTRELDTPMILVTAALAFVVTMTIGLAPALHAVRSGVFATLKAQARQAGGSRAAARFHVTIATVQVALSMVLIVLAGLFTKSLANLVRVDAGLQPNGLITFAISPQRNGYDAARAAALFDRVEADIAGLPGVTSVASSTTPLFSGIERATSVYVEGYSPASDVDRTSLYDEIGEGYFRTLGTPLVAGREMTRADAENTPKVVVVNERFLRQFGLGRDAVGKHISIDASTLDCEIVGVVRDLHHTGLRGTIRPTYFVPVRQSTKPRSARVFFVRTSIGADETMAALRQVVQRHDPNLPINRMLTMTEAMRANTSQERMMGTMTSAFAALALLVAAVGLYGVLAYTVTQRTPEIGLRMALGASRGAVRWIVLRQVGIMTAIGGVVGLAAAIAIGRAAQSLLFGLQFDDAAVLASAVGVLLVVVLAAAFLPADRAARIDPMRALRCD